MKRQWKVDHTSNINELRFWKGKPTKLPAPWIHVCDEAYYAKDLSKPCTGIVYRDNATGKFTNSVHVIKKLDNLEYIVYLKERTKI